MTDEVWETIAKAFADDPAAAFILAQLLFEIRRQVKEGRRSTAIETLEVGIGKLYPYTHDHKAAYELYLLSLAGTLKPQHDPTVIASKLL